MKTPYKKIYIRKKLGLSFIAYELQACNQPLDLYYYCIHLTLQILYLIHVCYQCGEKLKFLLNSLQLAQD